MKSSKSSLATALCAAIMLSAQAFAGTEGHGGHPDELAFVAEGRTVQNLLKGSLAKHFPEVDAAAFEAALSETTVEMVDYPLIRDGVTKAAMNYSKLGLIQVNRPEWKRIHEQPALLASTVFHEYLGIMKIEEERYGSSSRFLKLLKSSQSLSALFDDSLAAGTLGVGTTFVANRDILIPANETVMLVMGDKVPGANRYPKMTFFRFEEKNFERKISAGRGMILWNAPSYDDRPYGNCASTLSLDFGRLEIYTLESYLTCRMTIAQLKALIGAYFTIVRAEPAEL